MIKFYPDHFEDENKFCRALFILNEIRRVEMMVKYM